MSNAAAPPVPAGPESPDPDFQETTSCSGQSRNWVFTRQSTPAESAAWNSTAAATIPEPFRWHEDHRVSCVVYQIERAPKTGKLHVQGLICFKSSCKWTAIKALLGHKAHIEKMESPDGSYEYCTKEETRVFGPWEHGDRPRGKGKSKKKVGERIVEAVTTGKRTYDMILEDPSLVMHDRAIKYARFVLAERDSDRQHLGQLRVIVCYGKTGTGKTYSAINFIAGNRPYFKLAAPSKQGDKLWFDGYEGQKVLIMDDWDGRCCTAAVLKNLLDVYKLNVENKGGYAWAAWDTVVITSNLHPSQWFIKFSPQQVETEEEPLERRITEIRHYIAKNIYQVETWAGEPIGDQVQEPRMPRRGAPRAPTPPRVS